MAIRTYTTNFPFSENPMNQSSVWAHGATVGLDWTNCRTTPGKVFGTEPGNSGVIYDDSLATLQVGTWGNNQAAEATVFISGTLTHSVECELLLRTTITAHSQVGYEFNASCSTTDAGWVYMTIVRIEGAQGTFTNLANRLDMGVVNGDVMGFTAVGPVLTAYKNGVSVLTATDTTYPTGSPGMGFFLHLQTGINANYGFTHFAANDGGILPSLLATTSNPIGRGS